MKYEFEVTREVTAVETLNVFLEADSMEEANDFAYELVSEYPNSAFICERLTTKRREYLDIREIECDLVTIDGPKRA